MSLMKQSCGYLWAGSLALFLSGCVMDQSAMAGDPWYQDRSEEDPGGTIRGYGTQVEPVRDQGWRDPDRYGRRDPYTEPRRYDDGEPYAPPRRNPDPWRDPDRRDDDDSDRYDDPRRYEGGRRYGTGSASLASFVDEHNRWRRQAGASPLRWSGELADHAQRWADRLAGEACQLRHSQDRRYGENLAWSRGRPLSPQQVVNMWGREVQDYSYDDNRCAPGRVCGHYTQMVWADTRELGCGTASCNNSEIWVCNYYPAGNYVGERPY